MTTTSPLVQRALVATAAEMGSDVEIFGVPVDLPGRAVVFVRAPIRLVVKVETDPHRMLRETETLPKLAGRLPVPEVWFTAETGGQEDGRALAWVAAQSFLDGERLSQNSPNQAWTDAGSQLRVLHEMQLDDWPQHPSHPELANGWATQLAKEAKTVGLVDDTIATAFLQRTIVEIRSDREPVLIHGELSADHVLHAGETVTGLIDFGDCGIGDPAYDLANLTLWNYSKMEDVVRGYGSPIDGAISTEAFQADVKRFQIIRLLAGALWLNRFEFATTPYVAELYERLLD